jgi:hypothetical protein
MYVQVTTEVIGQSYAGKDMRVIKICSDVCGNKPAMYIQGGMEYKSLMTLSFN